jgi:hypothetical protein
MNKFIVHKYHMQKLNRKEESIKQDILKYIKYEQKFKNKDKAMSLHCSKKTRELTIKLDQVYEIKKNLKYKNENR